MTKALKLAAIALLLPLLSCAAAFFATSAATFAATSAATSAADSVTIYLVRHAEKIGDGSPDPALTDLGEQRALAFAELLRGKNVTHIFSTPYIRTRRSALPTAIEHGLSIEEYDPADAANFASKLKTLRGTILVTGHSNTIPGLVNLLAATSFADLDDSVYDHVFIVSINNSTDGSSDGSPGDSPDDGIKDKGAAQLRMEYTQPRTPAPTEFRPMAR